MNKKVLVAGVAVAAVVAGGLYFGPGNGGQGFIFRIPQREAVTIEVPNINLADQDLTGKKFQIRNGVGYEPQGGGSRTNDDAVATKKPLNFDAKKDFSFNPDAMYQGDGQKRTPQASPGLLGDSGKKTKPVLGSGNRGGSTPAAPVVEEPVVDPMVDFAERKAAQHALIEDKIDTFQSFVWQYDSGLRALEARGCADFAVMRGLEYNLTIMEEDARYMKDYIGFISNGYIDYRFNLGEKINSAQDRSADFGTALDLVPKDCLDGNARDTLFTQGHSGNANQGAALKEVKEQYDVMMNNALY